MGFFLLIFKIVYEFIFGKVFVLFLNDYLLLERNLEGSFEFLIIIIF